MASPATARAIEVTVENVRSTEGMIFVQICPQKQFLGTCAIGQKVPARIGKVVVRFADVPPGTYAAMAFHDRNDNGVLDKRFALPREDFGFSRMEHVPRLPPRFSDYAFTHDGEDQAITVKLSYYFG
ncbi:DUF2141 domain-containing protein [Sphingomonas sp. AP4-R1]|uniref:DUF2141 domain-containing protein n=1 Tax=Sphingomonas sp. AP4-R1 TaxID=2735134 RepID=UPI001493CDEB|nr:DUF2141 domain-containing protein [Sphingomonas sp. AP4-R1]QJU58690.1 DUF2141 domain-containing protein [Sphingomonas sp. AP4-R1]